MILVLFVLALISTLLIWQFVGYPLLMGIIALRAKPWRKNRAFTPFVSIIVPAYNEGRVIGRRIENLIGLDYPRDQYEIIIVESGSTDGTHEIVERAILQKGSGPPELRLLRETDRQGKASAINLGKQHAKGEIVLVTDANSQFEPDVLREMMPHFEDPKVGAVGGRYLISNPNNVYATSESFYWDLEYIMRRGEATLDSACLFHGEINAWRKALAEADVGNLSEDLDTVIQIRRAGYRIGYEPSAIVYEPAATTAEDQIRQRKRTTIGTLQCIFKYVDYFLLPRDLYSLLIFPSHKGLVVLSPFLLVATAILYLLTRDLAIIATHALLTVIVFAFTLCGLLFVRGRLLGKTEARAGISLGSLPKIIYYVLLNEYLILLAWRDFVTRRYSILWEKAETARTQSAGPA
jgi:cellulose synthase/poly-beta-1,6-N-acetylglucosamine synthase-like glycosyltransferase